MVPYTIRVGYGTFWLMVLAQLCPKIDGLWGFWTVFPGVSSFSGLCLHGVLCLKFIVVHPAKIFIPEHVRPILQNFNSKMVLVTSRLWLLLFHLCLSGTAGLGASFEDCVQGPCASAAPESQGWKSGRHCWDGTTTICSQSFQNLGIHLFFCLFVYKTRKTILRLLLGGK